MSAGQNLIFLISQPRAGSTLLQKILGAHSEIHTLSEPWIALHPLFALRPSGTSALYSHSLACTATQDFLASVPGGKDTYREGVRLMLNHLYDAALAPSGKAFFLDKTPRYYFIVNELRQVFPEARFIFLLRNPLAVFNSILQTWIRSPHFGNLYAFRSDLMHDLVTAPEVLATAIANPAPNTAIIRYEDLVQSPTAQIAALCEQLHLAFHPGMIEYGTSAAQQRWAFGDQGTVYSEQRPVAERAGLWQRMLAANPGWRNLASAYLQALGPRRVEQLGYDFPSLAAAVGSQGQTAHSDHFLKNVVLTNSYGDSCNFVSQLSMLEEVILRAQSSRLSGEVR